MQHSTQPDVQLSPFHKGEQELQTRTGKRDVMESFGRRAIRPFMPDQHREFYAQLPFMVVGNVDEEGWPWASILPGKPGFMTSPDPKTLNIDTPILDGDPLAQAIQNPGAPLGLLGIELMTRRRNRLNGRVNKASSNHFSLTVDQSFGNCPQYIQHRSVDFIREPGTQGQSSDITSLTTLDNEACTMICAADTFFVSSFVQTEDRPEIEGIDVSHRGGRPGFVKVEGNTLTIPDYPGNYHFNTLGNFLINPKAGLVFADFETGDLLMLTGSVELLWEDEPEVKAFKGSERAWRFTLDHGLRLKDALPFRSTLGDYSPNTLLTGNWNETASILDAQAKRDAWRPYRLTHFEDESDVIRSFYLEPTDGGGLLPFEAGQFLTVRVVTDDAETPLIRTYTTSSAPGDAHYRISVKREPDGQVSNHLHTMLKIGAVIEAKAPNGDFYIDAGGARPAVLLAGGVGVTPMISMASHIANEGLRTRHRRPLTIFHSARTTQQRAFAKDFRTLEQHSDGTIRYYSFISTPAKGEQPGVDFNGTGRITADVLRQTLPLDDYDFYLCGPPSFMQTLYDTLRGLGIRDVRILAEAFGPASLKRRADEDATLPEPIEEADEAMVKFTRSNFEQPWNEGDETILELAEAHGLTPEFGCRNGVCGSCTVKVKSGSVAYRTKPSASHAEDEALICCAVPAKGTDTLEIEL